MLGGGKLPMTQIDRQKLQHANEYYFLQNQTLIPQKWNHTHHIDQPSHMNIDHPLMKIDHHKITSIHPPPPKKSPSLHHIVTSPSLLCCRPGALPRPRLRPFPPLRLAPPCAYALARPRTLRDSPRMVCGLSFPGSTPRAATAPLRVPASSLRSDPRLLTARTLRGSAPPRLCVLRTVASPTIPADYLSPLPAGWR